MTAKKLAKISLSELVKRVPSNQREQFERFREKTAEYQRRVDKNPDKLPVIDWDFYRENVRPEYIKLVDEFKIHYEELGHSFAGRHEKLDHSKYYKELNELTAKVESEVKDFVEESSARIANYLNEIRRLKNLDYENMTLEEFIELREDIAYLIPRKGNNLFWPHIPEEQLGYVKDTTEESAENVERREIPKTVAKKFKIGCDP